MFLTCSVKFSYPKFEVRRAEALHSVFLPESGTQKIPICICRLNKFIIIHLRRWQLRQEASQEALVVKNLPVNAGDTRNVGSIPGLGRSPGEGHGHLLQYSCLESQSQGQRSLVGYSP